MQMSPHIPTLSNFKEVYPTQTTLSKQTLTIRHQIFNICYEQSRVCLEMGSHRNSGNKDVVLKGLT